MWTISEPKYGEAVRDARYLVLHPGERIEDARANVARARAAYLSAVAGGYDRVAATWYIAWTILSGHVSALLSQPWGEK